MTEWLRPRAPVFRSPAPTLCGFPVRTSNYLVEKDTTRTVAVLAPDWRNRMERNGRRRKWIDRHGRGRWDGGPPESLEIEVHPIGPSPNLYLLEGSMVVGHPETVAKLEAELFDPTFSVTVK